METPAGSRENRDLKPGQDDRLTHLTRQLKGDERGW